jgi:CRP/FNR family transcriptional regulator, anaerobic regulatory protein
MSMSMSATKLPGGLQRAAAVGRDVPCRFCQVQARAFCGFADSGDLSLLEGVRNYREYRAGDTIVRAGARIGFVGTLVAGTALVTSPTQRGSRRIAGLLFPADGFGHPEGARAAPHTIEAATDVVVCSIPHRDLQAMAVSLPHVTRRLLAAARKEREAARGWSAGLDALSVRARLAHLILTVVRSQNPLPGMGAVPDLPPSPGFPDRIYLPLSRGAVADYLGVSRDAAARQFGRLVEEGLVALGQRRQLRILDPERLRQAALGRDFGGLRLPAARGHRYAGCA